MRIQQFGTFTRGCQTNHILLNLKKEAPSIDRFSLDKSLPPPFFPSRKKHTLSPFSLITNQVKSTYQNSKNILKRNRSKLSFSYYDLKVFIVLFICNVELYRVYIPNHIFFGGMHKSKGLFDTDTLVSDSSKSPPAQEHLTTFSNFH